MPYRKDIRNGKHITPEDQQSLEETHDMVVKALPGQSYIKEDLHKVSTTQVTGEALKKVAVGGKGGFAAGTAGDVREQKKELNAEGRLFIGPKHSQDSATYNEFLEQVIVGWNIPDCYKEDYSSFIVKSKMDGVPTPVYEMRDTRDTHYDDFAHQGNLDASDWQRGAEWAWSQGHITDERINEARNWYNEICGYKDAWKYVGLNGAEHRRYRIFVFNTLNIATHSSFNPQWDTRGNFYEPRSYTCHHANLYSAMNKHWRDNEDQEYLDNWMKTHNNGHAYFIMWWLDQSKREITLDDLNSGNELKMWGPSKPIEGMFRLSPGDWRSEPLPKPSKLHLKNQDIAERHERERRLKSMEKQPKLSDLKIVYEWEKSINGKLKSFEK